MNSMSGSALRHWIAPFGNPRIRGCLRRPVDYRGLPRPSSPAIAKASIMRLNSLPTEIPYGTGAARLQVFCCLARRLSKGRRDFSSCNLNYTLLLLHCHTWVFKEHAPPGKQAAQYERRRLAGHVSDWFLKKEVIQPLVPQRLPCYDFIPVVNHTLDASVPCGFGQRLRVQSTPMM